MSATPCAAGCAAPLEHPGGGFMGADWNYVLEGFGGRVTYLVTKRDDGVHCCVLTAKLRIDGAP